MVVMIVALMGITAFYLPTLFAFSSSNYCAIYNQNFAKMYGLYILPTIITVLLTGIPDIIFFVGNIAILIQVRKHQNDVTSRGRQTSDDTALIRVTRTAVTLSLVHLILTLPIIINTNVSQMQLKNQYNVLDMGLWCLALSNYGINILIYITTSQVFRQELVKLGHLCRQKNSATQESNLGTTVTSVI